MEKAPKEYFLKRPFDIILSMIGLFLSAPFWLFWIFLIWIEDGRPIFYSQERVGKNGKIFKLLKFRSMIKNAEKDTGVVLASINDHRTTRAGRLMRKSAADELPQLWNIFKGDMSVVGPRPERPHIVEKCEQQVQGFKCRHRIKPGLTGVAQVFGHYSTKPCQKLKYDKFYIKKQSFFLDIRLIMLSLWVTACGQWEKRLRHFRKKGILLGLNGMAERGDKPADSYPFVSLIMPCRNEKDCIRKSLGSFLKTDYPQDRLEIIVVDGDSEDGTREIVEELACVYKNIKILLNKKKYVPFAMNMGIKISRGQVIIRADAHTKYPPDYISKCVEYLEKTDAWCVGGPFYSEPFNDTLIAKIITYIVSSPFGVATSYFRTHKKPMYTETVPYGAFRREVFDKIGLYDERFIRAQDYELCRRVVKHGGKIFMTPEIKNIYHPPTNVRDFIKKAQFTGACNAINLRYYSYTFHWRHFTPFIFFLGIIISLILIVIGIYSSKNLVFIGLCPIGLYFILAASVSLGAYMRKKLPLVAVPIMTGVFFLYHFIYGFGTLKGMLCLDPQADVDSGIKEPYFFKRAFDVVLAFCGIFMFLPIWSLIIFLASLERKKIFFIQERVGKYGKIFQVIKFRTMNSREEVKTRLHKFLRVSALDESPQLINILKGEMSFVGPRPLVIKEVLGSEVFELRSKVVPGLTGPAQILLSKEYAVEEKAKLDKWYIHNQSFLFDVKIILLSVKITLARKWEFKGKKLKNLTLFDKIST